MAISCGHHCVKKNWVAWVRKGTISTERPPLIGKVNANFLRMQGATWSAWWILRPYSPFSRPKPLLFVSSSSSVVLTRLRAPLADPLLLRKSGSAGNRLRASGSVARNSELAYGILAPVYMRLFHGCVGVINYTNYSVGLVSLFSREKRVFNNAGYNDINNIYKSDKRHRHSISHIACLKESTMFGKNNKTEFSLSSDECCRWTLIFSSEEIKKLFTKFAEPG
jgi:hypothetical protein